MNFQPFNQNIAGLSLLHAHLDGFLATTRANVYWKDKSGKYLGANQNQLSRAGLPSFNDLIGASDLELVSQKNAETLIHARQAISNDRHVMSNGNAIVVTEPGYLFDVGLNYISYKSPLLNRNGKRIGVFGFSYVLNEVISHREILDEVAMLAGKHSSALFEKFLLQNERSAFDLSKRQLDCLMLLAKGMTFKEIGAELSLSSRTVEHYIEAVKIKLKCNSRRELIARFNDFIDRSK